MAAVLRLITYWEEIVDGQPIHVSSNSAPVKSSNFEPAGHSFHSAALRISGLGEEEKTAAGEKTRSQTDQSSESSYRSKGRKKSDHYSLLGLAHLRYLATADQIRKGYRDAALKHHPDKQAAAVLLSGENEAAKLAKKEEIESHFRAIQEAYEVLTDPVRRRIFDSTDEFEDEIPTDCSPQDFFKVFGPAFLRNGRWSVTQPAPRLGDDATPMKEVDFFYNFWYAFKSWREFPDYPGWIDQARKDEAARVRRLVDNAYKRDPRILRRKEAEKAEKLRKKEGRLMAMKLQEEDAARKVEEEKRRKDEEERKAAEASSQEKKIREKEKKLLRKEKSRLRALVLQKSFDITSDDVDKLCSSIGMEKLKNLCDEVEESEEKLQAVKILRDALIVVLAQQNENGTSEANNDKVNGGESCGFGTEKKEEKQWSKEEIDRLRKGVVKYPKGTAKRWEVVSEYIGSGRSVEEILKATKTVLLQKPDSRKAFDTFLEKRKAAPTISAPVTTREEVEDHEDEWCVAEERALVQALKAFPKDVGQRWERVAAAVPGKTVGQCKKKFALLKEFLRDKKKAAV